MSHHDHHQQRREAMRAWPALDAWQTQLTKGNVRVGDAERDQAAASLGEHFATGRLDRDEYDERLSAVFAAKTWGDLAPLFRDLPGSGPMARTPRPPVRPARPRGGFGPPFLPVLLVLVGFAALTGYWFVIWLGLGLLLLGRRYARRSAYASGSRRPPRGSWS